MLKLYLASIGLIILLVSITSGCTGPAQPEPPLVNGTDLLRYITVEHNYANWSLWPGTGVLYEGKEPHGALLITYVSDNALDAIEQKTGIMPNGSIIVKENYNSEKELMAVTVMQKVKNYDPAHNDWFWLKFGPSGEIEAEGKVPQCYECHSARKDNDYLYTGRLK